MLTDQIKEQTKIPHQELEKLLVSHIKGIHSPEDYLKILSLFYKFFAPLEKDLLVPTEKFVPDLHERRKAEALIEDMEFFGSSAPPLPLALTPVLPIQSPAQALGVLYVMEGSTMGGPIISKMIAKRLNLPASTGFRFFTGYGEATMTKWKNFKTFINHVQWTQEEEKEMIEAANGAFLYFKQLVINELSP